MTERDLMHYANQMVDFAAHIRRELKFFADEASLMRKRIALMSAEHVCGGGSADNSEAEAEQEA